MREKPLPDYVFANQRRPQGWLGGAILLYVGLIFLVQTTLGLELHNGWALFLFIPTIAAWGSAWTTYLVNGQRLTHEIIGLVAGGAVTAAIAASFLLGFDWSRSWPIVLVIVGATLIATHVLTLE